MSAASPGAAPPPPGRRHHRLPGGRDHETELGAGVAMYLPVPLGPRGRGDHEPDVVLEGPERRRVGTARPRRDGGRARRLQLAAGEVGGRRRLDTVAGGPLDLGWPRSAFPPGQTPRAAPTRRRWRESGAASGGRCSSTHAGVPDPRARRRHALRAARRRQRSSRVLRVAAGDARIVGHLIRAWPTRCCASRPSRAPPRSASSTG